MYNLKKIYQKFSEFFNEEKSFNKAYRRYALFLESIIKELLKDRNSLLEEMEHLQYNTKILEKKVIELKKINEEKDLMIKALKRENETFKILFKEFLKELGKKEIKEIKEINIIEKVIEKPIYKEIIEKESEIKEVNSDHELRKLIKENLKSNLFKNQKIDIKI